MFAKFMALGSLLLVIASLPVSLFFVVKVVQVPWLPRVNLLSILPSSHYHRVSLSFYYNMCIEKNIVGDLMIFSGQQLKRDFKINKMFKNI